MIKYYGTACYPGGRQIEVSSPHPEWTQWAVEILNRAAMAENAPRSPCCNEIWEFNEAMGVFLCPACGEERKS